MHSTESTLSRYISAARSRGETIGEAELTRIVDEQIAAIASGATSTGTLGTATGGTGLKLPGLIGAVVGAGLVAAGIWYVAGTSTPINTAPGATHASSEAGTRESQFPLLRDGEDTVDNNSKDVGRAGSMGDRRAGSAAGTRNASKGEPRAGSRHATSRRAESLQSTSEPAIYDPVINQTEVTTSQRPILQGISSIHQLFALDTVVDMPGVYEFGEKRIEVDYQFRTQLDVIDGFVQLMSSSRDAGFVDLIAPTIPDRLVSFRIPESENRQGMFSLSDVAYGERAMVFLGFREMVIYMRHGNSSERVVELDDAYDNAWVDGDRIILARCHARHPNDAPNQTQVAVYDLNTDRKIVTRALGDPYGIELTRYNAGGYLDYTQGQLLVSDVLRYRIEIHNSIDEHLRPAVIERVPERWTSPGLAEYDRVVQRFGGRNGGQWNSDSLYRPIYAMLETHSTIRKAGFVNDSTIIVSWVPVTRPGGEIRSTEVFYDVWRRSGNEWVLLAADLEDYHPAPDERFSETRRWRFGDRYRISHGQLYLLEPLTADPYKGQTFELIRTSEKHSAVMREIDEPTPHKLFLYRFVEPRATVPLEVDRDVPDLK